ncbi:MAG: YkgJ family cysteine cluster protein [Phycisphaerales bacterium JB040]
MTARRDSEWFELPDPTGLTDTGEKGLRFACTQCGNCCSGPPGFVGFTDEEAGAIAGLLGLTKERFYERYTRDTVRGRTIIDIKPAGSPHGYDCVFLDRDTVPGKAVCGIYHARPAQCRTWPFWGSNLTSRAMWNAASKNCPGMNTGTLHPPKHIRITRDRVDI